MDQIILLINEITPYDAYLMRESLEAANTLRDELKKNKRNQEHEIARLVQEEIIKGMPASVSKLFIAYKICDTAIENLARYNKDKQGKTVEQIPLNALDIQELHQIMFGNKKHYEDFDPLIAGLTFAVYQFIQDDPAIGAKFTLEMAQDELTAILANSITLDKNQLHAALERVVLLQDNCDKAPFDLDEKMKFWFVNSEAYAYSKLMDVLELQEQDLTPLNKSIQSAQEKFKAEVEDEANAASALVHAKGTCRAYDLFIQDEMDRQKPTSSSIVDQSEIIKNALKAINMEGVPATNRLESLHKILSAGAEVIATNSFNVSEEFMTSMANIFKHCKMRVPAAFKTKGDELGKVTGPFFFKSAPNRDEKIAMPTNQNSPRREKN